MKSKVTLYLKSGALIKGVTTRVYYPTDAAGEAYLIRFNGISNAGIKGRGVIDGDGQAYRKASCPRGWNIHHDCPGSPMLVKIVNSTKIRVADVYERDPASWTNHVHYSDGITLEGLKVLADITANNNDGANVDASTNVTVRRVFVYVGDDAFCVKATNNLGLIKTSSNVVFQDNVVASAIKATKLGTETKVGG
ncbi:MAG: glycosyl hydrolase family 28 protein, partial [Armatimonadota bacterium]